MKTSAASVKCLLLFIVTSWLISCRKSDNKPDYPADTQENINSWILDSMKVYYYWNTALPGKPSLSQDPSAFFKSIKHSADRFSALVNPDLPATYPPSLVHTLGFDLITLQTNNGSVQTIVSLVVPGSGAESRGLLRGDVIKTIDGVVPTVANIGMLTANSITAATVDLGIERQAAVITVNRLTNSEDPVYVYKTFQSGGKTFGYLFLNSFEPTALVRVKTAFAYFKAQRVQELMIDLRYNPGGSVPVAAAIAAMLAPNTTEGNTFVEYRGNSNAGVRKSSFAAELNQLPSGIRMNFKDLISYRSGLGKVYFLTGSHTASAAELLVNALKPYLPVVQIGSQTLGKDMASFLIKDYRSPQIVVKWEIYPMIFKLYNAAGTGEYSAGLMPDHTVDEISLLPLLPFGDPDDPLIRYCLSGSAAIPLNRKLQSVAEHPSVLFDSRDQVDANTVGVTVARH